MERVYDFVYEQPVSEEVRVTDEHIELENMARKHRNVTVIPDDDDDEIHLTILPTDEFDVVESMLIYGVRWLIEITFRKLKQYTNIQKFHSTTLNGVLFEVYCTFLRTSLLTTVSSSQRHARTFRVIRNYGIDHSVNTDSADESGVFAAAQEGQPRMNHLKILLYSS